MKEVSDKFWSVTKFMDTYAGEAQTLLDYLDEVISNPYIEPDLKFIKETLIKVLNTHKHQISNLEMFALIRWEQTILNHMDDFVKVVPKNYAEILDTNTEVKIQEVLNNLKWQSSQMFKVLTDNICTFQRSYFDLQGPLLKIKNIGEDMLNAKNDLKAKFDKIWKEQEDNKFDDDLTLDLENILTENFSKLETALFD